MQGREMTSVARRYAPPAKAAPGSEGRAPVVLMVSGGADSTALLVLAATSKLDIGDGRGLAHIARERLVVLHVNHELRGIDAEEDEEFVRGLAERFGIPCHVEHADIAALAKKGDGNVENAGREFRYAAAAKLANELCTEYGAPRGAARIVTAHTADDRAETFFMNAIRGTGPSGLSSIPRQRNRIVRPLLGYSHEELCDLLRMRGIVWREDQTNADTAYLRAYVRHEIMPVVKARNPKVLASLATTCDILSDEDAYLTQVTSRTFHELERRRQEGMVALDAARLAATDVAVARRVVRQAFLAVAPDARLEARHIERTLELVAEGTGSQTIPLGVDVRVEHGLLFVRARSARERFTGGFLPVPGTLELPDGSVLTAAITPVAKGSDPVAIARVHGREWAGSSVLLDAERAGASAHDAELWVEPPQAGEVFCPLGMHGQSKKLSDALCDAKIPAADKQDVAVVHTGPTGHIVWVAGLRADERCRVSAATKLLLELRLESPSEGAKSKGANAKEQ